MWHTCAYLQSQTGPLAAATNDALSDNVFRIGPSNGFVLQEDMMLLMALVAPNNTTSAQLTSPKFAQFGPIILDPLQAAEKTADGSLIATWPYRPPTFRNQEEVVCQVTVGGTTAANECVVCSFSNGVDQIPAGEELTIGFTSSTAVTAQKWSILAFAFTQTLPEGRYALLASELFSSNGIAHRWTFWGQFYRPGFPSVIANTDRQWPGIRDYRMGLAGQFSNVTPPNLEALCSGADSSFTGNIRCIKVA
jgi:hypothetical protein